MAYNKGMKSIAIALCFLMSLFSFGSDQAVSERARKRMYPGGLDEDDLKVQSELPQPAKKTTPNVIQRQVINSLKKKKEEKD